jgi:hypothetical protein
LGHDFPPKSIGQIMVIVPAPGEDFATDAVVTWN